LSERNELLGLILLRIITSQLSQNNNYHVNMFLVFRNGDRVAVKKAEWSFWEGFWQLAVYVSTHVGRTPSRTVETHHPRRGMHRLIWPPNCLLPHAVNCGRFCFLALSGCVFFVCVWNIPGTAERICAKFTRKTCLVPRSDKFEGQD